jgi:hypothetical protein
LTRSASHGFELSLLRTRTTTFDVGAEIELSIARAMRLASPARPSRATRAARNMQPYTHDRAEPRTKQ